MANINAPLPATVGTNPHESPSDPQFGWRGVDTDIRKRTPLTNEELDAIRRKAQNPAPLSGPTQDSVSRLAYTGIPAEVARRIVALEAENFLMGCKLETLEARIAELEKEK